MYSEVTYEDVKHGQYLDVLGKVNSNLLNNYDIRQLLYTESGFCLKMSNHDVWMALIHNIIFPPNFLKTKLEGSDVVTCYTMNYRNDHDMYWNNILKDLGEHDELTILKRKGRIEKIAAFSLVQFIKRLNWFLSFLKDLGEINSKKDRRYLAMRLMLEKEVLCDIEKLALHPRVAMCFFDSAPYENLVMQYFKKIGAITVTNQHGQMVFRSYNYDRTNQSQILNFKCDFFLAKGDFMIRQFSKAGVDIKRIIPVGILGNKDNNIISEDKKNIIGIYLDTPALPKADINNLRLIEVVSKFAVNSSYHYFVKTHPSDDIKKYEYILKDKNCIALYGRDNIIAETFKVAKIAIVHASAVYVDSYFQNIRCFKLISDMKFPIAAKDDEVSTSEDLYKKINLWDKMNDKERLRYITMIQKDFDCGWNPGKIKKVIDSLKNSNGNKSDSMDIQDSLSTILMK